MDADGERIGIYLQRASDARTRLRTRSSKRQHTHYPRAKKRPLNSIVLLYRSQGTVTLYCRKLTAKEIGEMQYQALKTLACPHIHTYDNPLQIFMSTAIDAVKQASARVSTSSRAVRADLRV